MTLVDDITSHASDVMMVCGGLMGVTSSVFSILSPSPL